LTSVPQASKDGSLTATHGFLPLPPFEPGEETRDRGGVLRLCLSESSAGCCLEATQAMRAEIVNANRYPDSTAGALTRALADHTSLPEESIVVGNGIDELLMFIALVFLGDGYGSGVVGASTYPGHAAAVAAVRASCITVPLRLDLRVNTDAMADALRVPKSVAILCNPHNPTGTFVTADEVAALVQTAEENDSLLIIDEAYMEYAEPELMISALAHVREGRPVVVLRTFSKIYGLAGLRCGYALAPPALAGQIRRVKNVTVFNVNRYALAAAEAALGNQEFVAEVRATTRRAAAEFRRAMAGASWFTVYPSVTNFLLCELPWDAARVAAELSMRGVLVRPCTDLGFPRGLRIAIGTPREMATIAATLADVAELMASQDSR
jgi:histidinol-phosphate aminotransferase